MAQLRRSQEQTTKKISINPSWQSKKISVDSKEAPVLPKLALNNKFSLEFKEAEKIDSDLKGKVVPPELITI